MSPRFIASALLGLAVCAAHGQATLNLQRAAPLVRSDADLARLKTAPQAELQRLQAERQQVCQVKVNAAECDRKTRALNAAKPALDGRIQAIGRHEADARAGRLLKAVPGKAAVRVPAGNNNCGGCHTGGGTTPAADPVASPPGTTTIPNVLPGTAPAADPVTAVPGGGGAPQGSGGSRVTPPATASRCFIATAAYGSGDAEQVMVLRRFRDEHLVGHPAGDWFVQTYYRLSPPVADVIAERQWARAAVRGLLQPVVLAVRAPQGGRRRTGADAAGGDAVRCGTAGSAARREVGPRRHTTTHTPCAGDAGCAGCNDRAAAGHPFRRGVGLCRHRGLGSERPVGATVGAAQCRPAACGCRRKRGSAAGRAARRPRRDPGRRPAA